METEIHFEYRLVDTLNEDHQKYKALHNMLFKGAATSSEWIMWYHKEISHLKPWSVGTRTWGVFHEQELIGIWSVEPKNLFALGKHLPVGRCFAVGIHEDYRRHGLFVALSEFAIQQEKNLGEYEYILGFPQMGRSVIGGHFKAGWEEVQPIEIYSLKNESRILGNTRSSVNFIQNFTESTTSNQADTLLENALYRNLRWVHHPDHQYLTYQKNNGWIVLKPYGNFCHILDVSGSMEEVIHLLEVTKSLAVKHGWVEVNAWCADNEIYKEAFIRLGFSKGADFGLPVSLIAVRINANVPLVIDKCTMQMGIEEGY